MGYSNYKVIPSKGQYIYIACEKEGTPYVLKGLKQTFREKPQYQALLKKEYEKCHGLDDAHIVKYIDLIDDEQYGKCIVLEHLEGRSLSEYIRENHSQDEQAEVVNGIADALSYLHGRNIFHRNLKPSNIIITKGNDQVKLIDMRMPFADDLHMPYTAPVYLAPEQKDGAIVIDARADIFSFGKVMKEMSLPSAYSTAIEKCCSYTRNERPMDVASLMGELSAGGSERSINVPWKGILVVLAVVVVAALGYFGVTKVASGISLGNETAVVGDTVVGEQVAPKSVMGKIAPNPKADFLTPVMAKAALQLDSIYKPFIEAKMNGWASSDKALRKHIKAYYLQLLKSLGDMTPQQRQAFDEQFANEVNRHDGQLAAAK